MDLLSTIIVLLLYALAGAVLGALVAVSAQWYFDDISWIFVAVIAGACGVLAAFLGNRFFAILADLWRWS